MPQMIPSRPSDDCPESEKQVFAALAGGLSNDWTVFHAKRFVLPAVGRHRVQECEADFIILNPRRGVIEIEVKDGREIGRDADGWYSVDHQGRRHEIKDPVAQVQNAMHKLNVYLGAPKA